MTEFTKVRANQIKVGDIVDLEADTYADPEHDNDLLTYEYYEVIEIEHETTDNDGNPCDCYCIYFNGFTCGFPPDHLLTVRL